MQTKSLPEGVCNFPLRMTTSERSAWGRYTYTLNERTGENRSVGDVMRQALALGAEHLDRALATAIKEVRAERLRAKQATAEAIAAQDCRQQFLKFFPALTCLLVGAMAVVGSIFSADDDDLRRNRNTVRGAARVSKSKCGRFDVLVFDFVEVEV